MKHPPSATLAVVGVIHLLPLAGALGAFLIYAAFRKGWRTAVYVAAAVVARRRA